MIVCSCNVISDHAVRTACATSAPRTTAQVYGCLGCSAQCGRCARTITNRPENSTKAATRTSERRRRVGIEGPGFIPFL